MCDHLSLHFPGEKKMCQQSNWDEREIWVVLL